MLPPATSRSSLRVVVECVCPWISPFIHTLEKGEKFPDLLMFSFLRMFKIHWYYHHRMNLMKLKSTVILERSISWWIRCKSRHVLRISFPQANNLVISPSLLLHKGQILPSSCPVTMPVIPFPETRIQSVPHTSHSFFARPILTRLADCKRSYLSPNNTRCSREPDPQQTTQCADHF